MKKRLPEQVLEEIEGSYKLQDRDINRLLDYAKGLRDLRFIKESNF